MATSRLITSDEVISNFYNVCGIDEVNYDFYKPMFSRWVYQAIRSIGLDDQQIAYTTAIPITNLVIPIPSNLLQLIDIVLTAPSGHKIRPYWDSDYNPYTYGNGHNRRHDCVYINQQGSNYLISSNGSEYTNAHMKFLSVPNVDAFDEYYERAVTQFLRSQWVQRERSTNRKEVPMSEVDYEYNQWVKLLRDTKAHKNNPNRLQADAAMRIKTSMLPYYERMRYRNGQHIGDGGDFEGGIFDFTFDQTFN